MQHHRRNFFNKARAKESAKEGSFEWSPKRNASWTNSHYRFNEIISLLSHSHSTLYNLLFNRIIQSSNWTRKIFEKSDHSRKVIDGWLILNDRSLFSDVFQWMEFEIKNLLHVKCYSNENIEIQCRETESKSPKGFFWDANTVRFLQWDFYRKSFSFLWRKERTLWTQRANNFRFHANRKIGALETFKRYVDMISFQFSYNIVEWIKHFIYAI